MPRTDLFRVGTVEQDTLDELNAMLEELYAGSGGSQTEQNTTDIATNVAAIAANVTAIANAVQSATDDFPDTTSGAQTHLAANALARRVIITVEVTEVFADGDGTQPTFEIGETGSAAKFAATSVFTGAALGATFSFGGTLTAAADLLVTAAIASAQ
jgi:hypothetical protein